MANQGVGVFMSTPDMDIQGLSLRANLGPRFRFNAYDRTSVTTYGDQGSFYLFNEGDPSGEYGDRPVLMAGYYKYFVPHIALEAFRDAIVQMFGQPRGEPVFTPLGQTGFLGAFWNKGWTRSDIIRAASAACMGRCTSGVVCREEGCFCNEALGRCL